MPFAFVRQFLQQALAPLQSVGYGASVAGPGEIVRTAHPFKAHRSEFFLPLEAKRILGLTSSRSSLKYHILVKSHGLRYIEWRPKEIDTLNSQGAFTTIK